MHPSGNILRFFLDPGSGVCLWRASSAPADQEEYAVDHEILPLNRNTKAALTAVIAVADTAIDWENAPNSGPFWTEDARRHLDALVSAAFIAAKSELSLHGYQLIDEYIPGR